MARLDRRNGREVYNQFFLRERYMSNEAFEEAVAERLRNPYWDIGKSKKAKVKIVRNKHGARLIAYEAR